MVQATIPSKAMPKNADKKDKAPKEKKPKAVKTPYVQLAEVRSVLDGNGRLSSMPVTFDPKLHKAPRRTDFAGDHVFMLFRADVLDSRAQALASKAVQMRQEAETIQKSGDPTQRAKLKRAARLKDQLAELEAQLKAEGITL